MSSASLIECAFSSGVWKPGRLPISTMWLWLSMMPGTTVRPRRSMTRVFLPAWAFGRPVSTSRKRPSLITTEEAIVFFASMVWILPLMRMTSGSGCWFAFACAGATSTLPPAAAAALAAAVFMNLRRVKAPGLRLSWLIWFPFLSMSPVNDDRLGEAVEKPAGVVAQKRERSGNDDGVRRELHGHLGKHLGHLLRAAGHTKGAFGRLRNQQKALLRESHLERHHEAFQLHFPLVESNDLFGELRHVAVFLPGDADLGKRLPRHHGALVFRHCGLERDQQGRGRNVRARFPHRSPPLKNGVLLSASIPRADQKRKQRFFSAVGREVGRLPDAQRQSASWRNCQPSLFAGARAPERSTTSGTSCRRKRSRSSNVSQSPFAFWTERQPPSRCMATQARSDSASTSQAPSLGMASRQRLIASMSSGWTETRLALPLRGKTALSSSSSAVSMALARRGRPRRSSLARGVQDLARSPWILPK